ncbi:cytochrome c biogenesis protein CcmA [Sphingobacterium spiritivorum]|uniref:Cytochrome c biogenesis protein CcmA n=1 Tax=Sphingobacterium spiritivorum TaxID=258 RepID=A0A380CQR1_SPHSI|nr:AAA family ATPase [Sphingobacterium spiritivorum]SUJ24614.1 cytochrome c biogenesis protein CcmA [Sphingobacterium spiritivorum]
MIYIKQVENIRPNSQRISYPYNIPSIFHLEKFRFRQPVTFIVGENGSGKSTFIESIAIRSGFNPEGGSRNFNFSTKNSHSDLFQDIKIGKGIDRFRDGYFLRAESFYNVASEIDQLYAGDYGNLERTYGGSLHECSHGESFLALLHNRLSGKGLYIFDEPESALSFGSQLNMMVRIKELVDADSQFIIATHSPILLAYPAAEIYKVTDEGLQLTAYENTDQYRLTKFFMNSYQRILDELGL